MSKIKESIAQFLQTGETIPIQISDDFFSYNENIDEFTTNNLLYLTAYFINGYKKENDHLKQFINIVKHFNIVFTEILKIHEKLNETNEYERNDKLFLYNYKKEFKNTRIDFEDREYVMKLINYFFILSFEELFMVNYEMEIKKYVKKDIQKTADVKRPLLVRRIKPTMSLDDYADMIMKHVEKTQNMDIIKVTVDPEEERKKKEREDNSHFNTGNRKGYG